MPDPVLVTGDAGFTGSPLVERLLGEGRHAHVGDDLSTGRRQNLRAEIVLDLCGRHLARKVQQRGGSVSEIRLVPYPDAYGGGFEDMERRRPDLAKFRRVVGWTPTRSLDAIIDETVAYHRTASAAA